MTPTGPSPTTQGAWPRWPTSSKVREITNKLDAVGNTTAAIGKGFAIGSAALTSIILFSSYKEAAGIAFAEIADPFILVAVFIGAVIPFLFRP